MPCRKAPQEGETHGQNAAAEDPSSQGCSPTKDGLSLDHRARHLIKRLVAPRRRCRVLQRADAVVEFGRCHAPRDRRGHPIKGVVAPRRRRAEVRRARIAALSSLSFIVPSPSCSTPEVTFEVVLNVFHLPLHGRCTQPEVCDHRDSCLLTTRARHSATLSGSGYSRSSDSTRRSPSRPATSSSGWLRAPPALEPRPSAGSCEPSRSARVRQVARPPGGTPPGTRSACSSSSIFQTRRNTS